MRDLSRGRSLLEKKEQQNLPIRVLKLDVTNDREVGDGVRTVLDESGRIDVLINNAGFALEGAVEDISVEEMRVQFETNFFGVLRMTREVIPIMRNQGSGYIVNISSVGGRIATPFTGAYTATKFAVEGLTESLRYELRKFGIHVVLIEPGYIQTNFGRNVRRPAKMLEGRSAYKDLMKRSGRGHQRAFARGQQPELVARTIFTALSSRNPRLRYTAGFDAGLRVFLRRIAPERMFFWVVQKLYDVG